MYRYGRQSMCDDRISGERFARPLISHDGVVHDDVVRDGVVEGGGVRDGVVRNGVFGDGGVVHDTNRSAPS